MAAIIDSENVRTAMLSVNHAHKRRRIVHWVEETLEDRIADLQRMTTDPKWTASKPRTFAVYDQSAGKWRDEVCEPPVWPDQYIHHMIVQAIEPVLMKGMDYWSCGSIPGRGISHGMRGIKRWLREDKRGSRYAAELDIKSFYRSIKPVQVIRYLRRKIKDRAALRLIWSVIKDGIKIGFYISQWMANAILQPLDHLIREKLGIRHYIRYIDNLTLLASSKRRLHKAVKAIQRWLHSVGLKLKGNWQVFRTDIRMVNALGYRYNHSTTLLRKKNLLRLKRQLHRAHRKQQTGKPIPVRMANGLLSRIGQLKHCDSQQLKARLVPKGLVKTLKNIVRMHAKRKEGIIWQTQRIALAQ